MDVQLQEAEGTWFCDSGQQRGLMDAEVPGKMSCRLILEWRSERGVQVRGERQEAFQTERAARSFGEESTVHGGEQREGQHDPKPQGMAQRQHLGSG